MTIRELIEKLSKHDLDMPVVVMGYEYGYDEPEVYPCPIAITFDENWDGKKKISLRHGRHEEPATINVSEWKYAVLIGR